MPYAMVHLIIANNFAKEYSLVDNYGKFLLGAISPDSVHTRKDYKRELKAMSHLCRSEDKWGKIEDCSAWMNNVSYVAGLYRETVNKDFFLGYITHIVTDIYYDKYVTQQYRKTYLNYQLSAQDYKVLNLVQLNYDIELFELYEDKELIYSSLKECQNESFANIVTCEDTRKYKEIIIKRYQILDIIIVEKRNSYIHLTNVDNLKFIKDYSGKILKNVYSITRNDMIKEIL